MQAFVFAKSKCILEKFPLTLHLPPDLLKFCYDLGAEACLIMKRVLFFITIFIMFIFQWFACVNAEPSKVMSMHYDDSSSVIFLNILESPEGLTKNLKFSKLENPNRIYFDIENAILIGDKQQLVFSKSEIKEIRLSQFTTEPDVVRGVVTFEEGFDTSKVKLININGNILIQCSVMSLNNDYFNPIYDESSQNLPYSSVSVNSQVIQKVTIPQSSPVKAPDSVVADIQQAFENSILSNSDGKSYNSVVSVDLSSDLKLRTKYYINGYYIKNGGLLVNGSGQITASKMFCLDQPKRIVIDFPNTFVDKNIRNKEINICPDGSCKDTARIGQFEYNKARLVVTTDNAEKYIPVFSADAQSLLFINADKLKHTELVNSVSNLAKAYVRKIDNRTSELILSFTEPVVHSVLRSDNSLSLYFFNVKSYNELDLIKTFKNTYYKELTMSLLPQTGIRATMGINKDDIVKIDQSIDGKAIRLTIKRVIETKSDETPVISAKKTMIKGKVVLDAGHGGSDYGAIRDGVNEKDITLEITQRIASILKSKGYKVALTRSDDTYVSLQDRVEFSENETPEIFVSIHVNSAVSTEPKGIETHYYHDTSKELANIIHRHLMKEIDTKDRGLVKSKFYVINHTTVPAILVETGFLSNNEERSELVTDSRKKKTAKAIAEGIIEYIKSQQSK